MPNCRSLPHKSYVRPPSFDNAWRIICLTLNVNVCSSLTRATQLTEPEDFEHWEKLVRAAEAQEGGLNRNSSPSAIEATRKTYDEFLARFPLFYGFWKRYADLEFAIGGTEAAEMVGTKIFAQRQHTLTAGAGLRARRCQHRHIGRPLDKLLRFPSRDQPRCRRDQRVSIRALPSFYLPLTTAYLHIWSQT
jgi:hypothetical protein